MAKEDLGLDKLQAGGIEGLELLFRVRLSWLKGRHGAVMGLTVPGSVSLCTTPMGSCLDARTGEGR